MNPTVLAGDLGGTKCRFAIIDSDFGVSAVEQFRTVRERSAFLERFDAAIRAVLARAPTELARPSASAFGVAGLIPKDSGVVTHATNLPLNDYALAQHMRERFDLPAVLLNDGRASAWGEFLRGTARGADPLLCLFFGTGIGIGLMVGGKPYAGGENAAGEVGHTTFVPGGRRCPCGQLGHFEAYCGGRAITERAAEVLGPADDGDWTVGDVVAAASSHAGAAEVLEDAAIAACVLVENLCTVLNPAAVVLGGGVLAGWPALRQRLEQHLPASTRPAIHERIQVVSSLGGSDAVLWGVAAATGALSRS